MSDVICSISAWSNYLPCLWHSRSAHMAWTISSEVMFVPSEHTQQSFNIFLYFLSRYPFNTNNTLLYFLFCVFVCLFSIIYMLIFSAVVSLYIGCCHYICACFDVLRNDALEIERINFESKRTKCYKLRSDPKHRFYIISMIKFHLIIIEIMTNVQQIMSGPFFKQLCTYAVFIGHTLNSKVGDYI